MLDELNDDKISSALEEKFYNREIIMYEEIKNNNELLVASLAYLFDFNFKVSIDLLEKCGYLKEIENSVKVKSLKPYFRFVDKLIKEDELDVR